VHWWASNWDGRDRTTYWLYMDWLSVDEVVGLYVRALRFDSRLALQNKSRKIRRSKLMAILLFVLIK
jgi:hypothetical protein